MSPSAPPVVVAVTGPPGAGKSSALIELGRRAPVLARFGVRDYGLHLAAEGDPLGLVLREPLLRQELLTDELVQEEFLHFLDRAPARAEVVAVEGYPRDERQCDGLLAAVASRGARVGGYVIVDIPDDLARQRVRGRRICVRCGAPTDAMMAVRCGACGGALARRRDDAAGTLDRRLADFRRLSRGPRDYFATRGLLREVDGAQPAERVLADLAGVLGIEVGAVLAGPRP
ncbi:nucleoside monophosphate kinase [Kutzneria buriramensis]|uniref:Adenylate kinase n=1 Tax=Kutzneria buriramensis TaxID=1045776 RepID=A0A3E0GZC2_9PSEU|nr:nucleoside monophosphate kinase [Kutzneria buriramensis]REH35685.1 adenylate kinase family enzyme [Kutzneria buriramensis]